MGGAAWREQRDIPRVTAGDVEQYDAGQIGDEMKRIKEHSTWVNLRDAGGAWGRAGEALDDIAQTLRQAGSDLAGAWRGEDAVAYQQALQRMEGTARHLAGRARDQEFFSSSAAADLEWTIENFPWGQWYRPGGQEDREHREALQTLNTFYENTSVLISHSVSAELPILDEMSQTGRPPVAPERPDVSMPPPTPRPPDGFDPSTSTAPAGGFDSMPEAGTAGSPGDGGMDSALDGGGPGTGGFPENDLLGEDDRSTGGLAGAGGFGPTGAAGPGSGIGPGGPGAGGGIGAGGGGGGALGGGPAGAGLGGVAPTAVGTGSGVAGRGAGAAGTPGAGAGGGGRGSTGGGGRPVAGGMAPMMGGGRGGEGEKSSRDTWLTEDDDPWASDNEAPPSVIES